MCALSLSVFITVAAMKLGRQERCHDISEPISAPISAILLLVLLVGSKILKAAYSK